MEDKFCSSKTKDFRLDNVSSVISIRGYAPPLRATKIYTFLLEEFGTRSLDATRTRRIITVQTEKKIGFQGRGGQTVFLNFEPDFCRRIPPERFFLLLFFSQDSLSYVLDAFFHLFYPRPISRRNNIEWRNFLKLPISQETNRMRIRFTIQIFYIYLRFKKYQTIFHCII